MSTWIPAFAALLATFAALTVPRVTFQLALRQDAVKWHRDQRAQLYVDLLVEAHAEKEHLQYELAREQLGPDHDLSWYTDLRLPAADRARLGARAAMFASSEVLRLFNTMHATGFKAMLPIGGAPVSDGMVRVEMGRAFDALEQVIRAEMRTTASKLRS